MLEHLRPHWTLAGLLLVALVVRLFASAWWQSRLPEGQRFGFPDSDGYWELAEDIAAGRPYEYQSSEQRIFRTPGYPLLLGCTFRLLGPQASPSSKMIAARLLSAVLGTISVGAGLCLGKTSCWASGRLGRRSNCCSASGSDWPRSIPIE